MTGLSDKLVALARELSYARGVKDAARIRRQCGLEEWPLVLVEAKRFYGTRK
jgi:hypothetical protein